MQYKQMKNETFEECVDSTVFPYFVYSIIVVMLAAKYVLWFHDKKRQIINRNIRHICTTFSSTCSIVINFHKNNIFKFRVIYNTKKLLPVTQFLACY